MRGRRLPEIATGDFMDTLAVKFDRSLAQLLQELPAGLTGHDRARLVHDYSQGRAHLMFQFVLKLHAMQEPPRLLYGMAHHNPIKARAAVRVC
jgi:hypothetical protein